MAMYGLFTFDTAWHRGQLYFPWVDFLPTKGLNIPVKITLSDSGTWPMAASLVLALLMAVGLGLAAHFLVFRPLRHAAPLGKVVASLGLALYLQGVALINFGNSFPQPENVVPEETIENFLGLGKPYPGSNLYVIAFAVLMGFVLWAAYRYLRFGLATRAAAGNEKGAVLLGFSPADTRRHQLGDRLGARHALGDHRRPDRRHDHPRRSDGADRAGARRSSDRRSALHPDRRRRWVGARSGANPARRQEGHVVRRQLRVDADRRAQLPAVGRDHRGPVCPRQVAPDPRGRRGEATADRSRSAAGLGARVLLDRRAHPDGVRLRGRRRSDALRQLDADRPRGLDRDAVDRAHHRLHRSDLAGADVVRRHRRVRDGPHDGRRHRAGIRTSFPSRVRDSRGRSQG